MKCTTFLSGSYLSVWVGNGSMSHQEAIPPSAQLTPACVDAGTWQSRNGWGHQHQGLETKAVSLEVVKAHFCRTYRNNQVLHVFYRCLSAHRARHPGRKDVQKRGSVLEQS